MNKILKNLFLIVIFTLFTNLGAQETFILNYEDVDIKKVTQDIAQFSKKQLF